MRTLEVFIDDELITTWTSSGTTTDFETIEIGSVPGKIVELRGVLADDEWLSISEVGGGGNAKDLLGKYLIYTWVTRMSHRGCMLLVSPLAWITPRW